MRIQRAIRSLLAGAAIAAGLLLAAPAPQAHAAVFITAGYAPPVIPYYAQPMIPGPGYLWTPGYWAWGPNGYYWVDGAWVLPPYEDALWTPGYWGWNDGGYLWYPGYWGTTVGFYGGINYGFGYFGTGFYGGYWNGGHFFYNRAYNHIGVGFRGGTYNRAYAGFSGRPGGAAFASRTTMSRYNHGAAVRGSAIGGRSVARSENRAGASVGRGYAGERSFANRPSTTSGAANRSFSGAANRSYANHTSRATGASQARSSGGENRGGGAPHVSQGGGAAHVSPGGGGHGGRR